MPLDPEWKVTTLSKAERAFLTVLANYPDGRDRTQLGILAGYSPTSGHIDNIVGGLRTKGWAEQGWPLRATERGLAALGTWEPLPIGKDLQAYWMRQLAKAEAAFLQVVINAYPDGLSRDQVAERAGYRPTSGHVDNTLGRLRTLELVTGRGGAPIRASDALF